MSVHVCRESANPRHAGRCDCGQSVDDVRDAVYEQQFLREAAAMAARRFGIATDGFVLAVERRLELGQRLYGNAFLHKDLGLEIGEEGWDAGAYAILEVQKRLGRDEDDSVAWHLFEIAVHAAAIDFHSRQIRD